MTDPTTTLKEGPWESQLEEYLQDITGGRGLSRPTYVGGDRHAPESDNGEFELREDQMLQPSEALTSGVILGTAFTHASGPLPDNEPMDDKQLLVKLNLVDGKLATSSKLMATVNAASNMKKNWIWIRRHFEERIDNDKALVRVTHNAEHARTKCTVELFREVIGPIGKYKM